MKEKRDCKIVQDLLPNYIEKLTSEETNEYIKEHINECEGCKNTLENMQKDIEVSTEKRNKKEVDYIKKYNKKMKLWKKILLVVLFIIIIYLLSVIYRFVILSEIENKNEISNSSTNYYYKSISNDSIMECYKKDGIIKVSVKQVNGDNEITFWKDNNTNEEYVFRNIQKVYSENANGMIQATPSSSFTAPDFETRFMVSLNPLVFIGTQKYNGVSCYYIRYDRIYDIIEKESGLIVYSQDNDRMRIVQYEFDTVTDEDVKLPDISEYTLLED